MFYCIVSHYYLPALNAVNVDHEPTAEMCCPGLLIYGLVGVRVILHIYSLMLSRCRNSETGDDRVNELVFIPQEKSMSQSPRQLNP